MEVGQRFNFQIYFMNKGVFGLPEEVIFCKRCVESNQRFTSSTQHKMKSDDKKESMSIDKDGVCSSCRYYENHNKIDWNSREKELKNILDKHRRSDGHYDVLVPGSGGKDSIFTSFILKEKYKMNPLTCTWAPGMYTDIGWKNFRSWINSGFDNILFTPNKKIHGLLTKLAFKNILYPFQPFVLGQHSFPVKVALEKKIKLIFSGDGFEERSAGASNSEKEKNYLKKYSYFSSQDDEEIFLGGESLEALIKKYKLNKSDLLPFLPVKRELILDNSLEWYPITKFINYNPQNNYYFAKERSNFQVNPDGRSEGTYTKYSSLDDKLDGLHYYTWFIKTGRGRATEDAAIEIRNKIITREEGIALVKKYDGEFPKKYFQDCLEHMKINEEEFHSTIDKFRSPHIWKKDGKKWILKHAVWK